MLAMRCGARLRVRSEIGKAITGARVVRPAGRDIALRCPVRSRQAQTAQRAIPTMNLGGESGTRITRPSGRVELGTADF